MKLSATASLIAPTAISHGPERNVSTLETSDDLQDACTGRSIDSRTFAVGLFACTSTPRSVKARSTGVSPLRPWASSLKVSPDLPAFMEAVQVGVGPRVRGFLLRERDHVCWWSGGGGCLNQRVAERPLLHRVEFLRSCGVGVGTLCRERLNACLAAGRDLMIQLVAQLPHRLGLLPAWNSTVQAQGLSTRPQRFAFGVSASPITRCSSPVVNLASLRTNSRMQATGMRQSSGPATTGGRAYLRNRSSLPSARMRTLRLGYSLSTIRACHLASVAS